MSSPELKRLGALGRGIDPGGGRERRRQRGRASGTFHGRRFPATGLFGAIALLLVAVSWILLSARGQVDELADLPAAPGPPPEAVAAEADPPDGGRVEQPRVSRSDGRSDRGIAAVEGLVLTAPSMNVSRLGFYESRRGTALPMQPIGELVANDNGGKFEPGEDLVGGLEYHVLPTRGEPWPATSSLAVVLPLGGEVVAPVSGEITEVARYPLADGRMDVRVRIVAHGHPELAVELRHLSRVPLRVGERVEAGESVVGRVRDVRVDDPADAVTGDGEGYLRVEVRPAREAAPPDPNAPAESDAD